MAQSNTVTRIPTGVPLYEAWKFFSSEHLSLIRDRGSVRIGTSDSFRVQDGYDDGRGDPLEMVDRWGPGPVVVKADHPFFRDMMGENFPKHLIGTDCNVIIDDGAVFHVEKNGYLLCLSDRPDLKLCSGMWDRFGYDMFYHIPSLENYVKMLMDADPRLQNGGECRRVIYDVPEGPESQWRPGIFHKRSQFAWQREIRFVWQGQPPFEPFTVEVPDLHRLISIERNPAAQ